MKTDLATTAIAVIAGFTVAFLVCNFLLPELSSVSFKELQGEITYTLPEPDVNVFNYRALNPTVEVYVGDDDDETQNQPTDSFDLSEPEQPEQPFQPEEPLGE